MGLNDKAKAIAKLRTIINDTAASPQRRIQASVELLARFGPSKRAVPLIKSIIRTFEEFQDASLTKQKAVRAAVEQLEESLKLAIKTAAAQKELAEDDEEELPVEPSAETPATTTGDPAIGGLELLPDPSDERAWELMVELGHSRLLTVPELLASIDIALWIGEKETTNRTPVNLARPSELRFYAEDSELSWESSASWAVAGTREARAFYYADLAARVHARLNELGIATDAGVYISLEDLNAELDATYQKQEAPYIQFEKVHVDRLYGHRVSQSDLNATTAVRIGLTDTGEKRRFLNLLKARIKHGFDIYGHKLQPMKEQVA